MAVPTLISCLGDPQSDARVRLRCANRARHHPLGARILRLDESTARAPVRRP